MANCGRARPPWKPIDWRRRRKDAYAPSLPNSLVHSAFLVRSSPLTVGREALMALMKSRTRSGGSSSSSPVRSVQDFSCACASPGEQGVHFVSPSTSTYGEGVRGHGGVVGSGWEGLTGL
jgi:hypothetical protein